MTPPIRSYCPYLLVVLMSLLLCGSNVVTSLAQCSTASAPTYTPNLCYNQYFTSISASGTAAASTIGVTASSCSSTYTDYFASQGITATIGSTVNISISRYTDNYTAYVSLYVDWDNNGIYDPSELTGHMLELDPATMSGTYTFVVPSMCSLVPTTNLRMRLMLSESLAGVGAPCAARYGQAYDFYMNAACAPAHPIFISPSSTVVCGSTSGNILTVSGAAPGVTYYWAPASGLSSTIGSSVRANPVVNTIYTVTACSGCAVTTNTVSVYDAHGIVGPRVTCAGYAVQWSDDAPGGVWSTSNTTLATIDPVTGLMQTLAGGNIYVYYNVGGCGTLVETLTIGGNLVAGTSISGPSSICTAGSGTYTDAAAPPGIWSSSASSIATIGQFSGVLSGSGTGGPTGQVVISYTIGFCAITYTVDVQPSPQPISGLTSVCVGATIPLTDQTTGGSWTSGNNAIATVDASGVVTGVSAGTTDITFMLGSCPATYPITVYAVPVAITGTTTLCSGNTSQLHNTVAGGVWSSSNSSVATISTGGLVTGVSGGTSTITYNNGGCSVTALFTVNQRPTVITGLTTICSGSSIPLSNTVSGGVWTSSNHAVATISSGGMATGVAGGTSTITYDNSGCFVTSTIHVNQMPSAISGSTPLCTGNTYTFTDIYSGGNWSSSNLSVATTLLASGTVSAVAAGTSILSYTIGICSVYTTVSVATTPVVTGGSLVCQSNSIGLAASVGGGNWSSSNSSIIGVSGSGVVTGNNLGGATITYSTPTCYGTRYMPCFTEVITGPSSVCIGSSVPLASSMSGGLWSSVNNSIATVDGSGHVYGVSSGTVNISYYGSPCGNAGHTITVGGTVSVSGTHHACNGASGGSVTYTLTGSPGGGTWSTSNPSLATMSWSGSIGTVHTVYPAAGPVDIYYNVAGCVYTHNLSLVSTPFVVSPFPIQTYGSRPSSPLTLTAGPIGGNWSYYGTCLHAAFAGNVTTHSTATVTFSMLGPGPMAPAEDVYYEMTDGVAHCMTSWTFNLNYW